MAESNVENASPSSSGSQDIVALLKKSLPADIDPQNWQQVEEYVKTANIKIRIMATGASGVGKSTLLNGIIGKNVFKVGRESLEPVTIRVDERKENIGGISVIVLDSPGLHDRTDNEKSYLQQMQKLFRANCGMDLILYCRRMDKLKPDTIDCDVAIIEKLTTTLGKEIWKYTLFVLTFANMYERMVKEKNGQDAVKSKFDKRVQLWKQKLEDALHRCSVECHVEVHVCPAGKSGQTLCGNEHWLSDFWASALYATLQNESKSENTGTLALLLLTLANGRFKSVEEASEPMPASASKQLEDQPIVLTDKVKKVLGVIAGGGAAAGVGAAVGATIGAVCKGVVSFGPAAGAGLVIGGFVGAAIGSAVSGAVLKLHGRLKAATKEQSNLEKKE